jgi:hypothetical protein
LDRMSMTIMRNIHLVVKPKDANNTKAQLWSLSTRNPHNQLPKILLNVILSPTAKINKCNSEPYGHQLPYVCLTTAAVLMYRKLSFKSYLINLIRAVFFMAFVYQFTVMLQSCVSYK